MSKQRVINSLNLPTNYMIGDLVRSYGVNINNRLRYDISCEDVMDKIEDLIIMKDVLDKGYCYSEEGESRDIREEIINRHIKNIGEI